MLQNVALICVLFHYQVLGSPFSQKCPGLLLEHNRLNQGAGRWTEVGQMMERTEGVPVVWSGVYLLSRPFPSPALITWDD